MLILSPRQMGEFWAKSDTALLACPLVSATLKAGHMFQRAAAFVMKVLQPLRGTLRWPAVAALDERLLSTADPMAPSKSIATTGFLLPLPPSLLLCAFQDSILNAATTIALTEGRIALSRRVLMLSLSLRLPPVTVLATSLQAIWRSAKSPVALLAVPGSLGKTTAARAWLILPPTRPAETFRRS
jgi:hypothetical protein